MDSVRSNPEGGESREDARREDGWGRRMSAVSKETHHRDRAVSWKGARSAVRVTGPSRPSQVPKKRDGARKRTTAVPSVGTGDFVASPNAFGAPIGVTGCDLERVS